MSDTGVLVARLDDLPALAACLARAFETDPIIEFLYPERSSRLARSTRFHEILLRRLVATGFVDTVAGLHGAAAWEPWPPRSAGPWLGVRTSLAMALAQRSAIPRARRLARALEQGRPPGWRLAFLAVDPNHQGEGLGAALLHAGLRRCDEAGARVSVDTLKDKIPFYERYGFQVAHELRALPVCPMWTLERASIHERNA